MAAREVKGRKVRYAVVGGGWISQAAFMPGVEQTGNSEMVALVTGNPDKADKLAQRYNLRSYRYDQYDQLLASGDIDAVYLALPNAMHADYAIPTLDAGIHLLLEKPMATTEDACQAMIDAGKRSGAKLMVAYRLHFEPGTLDIIRRVRAGEIGNPLLFTSTFSQFVSDKNHRMQQGFWAGPVPDMGPYPINAVRNLFGAEPIEVAATGFHTRAGEFHDTVAITLRFPDDRMANIAVSYSGAGVNEYRVVGTKGDIAAQPGFTFGHNLSIAARSTIEGKETAHTYPSTDQFSGETRYFSDCVINGRDPEPDGEEGLLDVRVLCAIERALGTGRSQTLPPVTRAKRPQPDQAQTMPSHEPPPMIEASEPGKG